MLVEIIPVGTRLPWDIARGIMRAVCIYQQSSLAESIRFPPKNIVRGLVVHDNITGFLSGAIILVFYNGKD